MLPPPPRPTLFPYTTLFRPRPPPAASRRSGGVVLPHRRPRPPSPRLAAIRPRSEEHTSELQSRGHLVCRLLLEKKKHTLLNSTTQVFRRSVAIRWTVHPRAV